MTDKKTVLLNKLTNDNKKLQKIYCREQILRLAKDVDSASGIISDFISFPDRNTTDLDIYELDKLICRILDLLIETIKEEGIDVTHSSQDD